MLFTAVLVQTIIRAVLCLRSSSFLLREGFEVSSSSILETNFARNNFQCASRCLSYDDCVVASHDKNTSMCTLHGNVYLSFSNNSQYEIMEMTGRHGTSEITEKSHTAGTSETTVKLGTAVVSETTDTPWASDTIGTSETTMIPETTDTTWASETIGTSETTMISEATMTPKTTSTLETTEKSETTIASETTMTSETTMPSETTETSETSQTSDKTGTVETTEASETSVIKGILETTETSKTTERTDTSETTMTPKTTMTSETTGTSETTMTSVTTDALKTTGTSETTVTSKTTMSLGTTDAPDTTETSAKTETSKTTGTSATTGTLETTVTSETTHAQDTTETSATTETTKKTGTSATTGTSETTMTSQKKNWTALGAHDCFPTTSLEYSGTWSSTVSGIPCQYWNKNRRPHQIQFMPVDTTAHSTNYCRETTNREGAPGCYTSNPSVQWEYCFIVKCDACGVDARLPSVPAGTTYSFQVGKYIGMMFTCNSLTPGTSVEHCPVSLCGDDDLWTTDYAVSCTTEDCYTAGSANMYSGKVTCTVSGRPCVIWDQAGRSFPTGPVRYTNYCRDPDNTGKPWCYVSTSPATVWDYCPVPTCP